MANRYWVASSAGTWNDTFNWSTTSGGIGGASVPGASDRAIFDSNGSGDCNITSTARSYGFDTTNYTGTIDVQSGITWQADSPQGSGLITIGQNATVTGSGTITSQGATVTPTGTFDVATFTITRSQNLNPGTYGNANFNFHPGATRSLTLNAGDYIFEGDVSVGSNANATWKNSSHNPNITFKGNVSLDATYGLWSAGNGTITFDNTAAQAVNFNGQTVEAVIVSDASTGTITLGADFTTPYVHDCDSLIDLNGFTITETGTDPSPCSSPSYFVAAQFNRLGIGPRFRRL